MKGLTGLEKMSHVWILFHFHESHSKAKPLVRPPRAPDKQIGVYATRAPYRPAPIGLSLVQVGRIEKNRLYISNVDLLDGTPIFDIKPYVTESDCPENPNLGWIEDVKAWTFTLSDVAQAQLDWLVKNGLPELPDVLQSQLGTSPLQIQRKRIKKLQDEHYEMAYRTWRWRLEIDIEQLTSKVLRFSSAYRVGDLKKKTDPYSDKDLHRKFVQKIFF